MNWGEVGAIAATFIVSLGGGGAIVLGLSNRIGRILGDRYVEKLKHEIQQEIESYKTKLRKSEFLFQKEFEAASQFMSVYRGLRPDYRVPNMEWDDACEDFARKFDEVEEELERYRATHGAALQRDTLNRLSSAITKASWGKVEVEVDEGIKLAGQVMEELGKVEEELHEAVWSQSST